MREEDVELIEGGGTPTSGGGPGGHYWHIRQGTERVGRVYINLSELAPGTQHPSITVEINQKSRGRGIGSVAFRRAAELSGHKAVYATVRKGNTASRIALERAGYRPVQGWEGTELYLVWKRDD